MYILDYNNERTNLSIDLTKVDEITVTILTGDEVIDILYLDGTSDHYDSSDARITDYYDGSYVPYSIRRGINYYNDWLERKDSYDGMEIVEALRRLNEREY